MSILASVWFKARLQTWKALAIAILIPAILFIAGTNFYAAWNLGFNPRYIIGRASDHCRSKRYFFCLCPLRLLLPIMPLKSFRARSVFSRHELLSYSWLCFRLTGSYYIDKPYTAITFLGLSFFSAFLALKVRLVSRDISMYRSLLCSFLLIINSVLTGSFIQEEVVWYNVRLYWD